MSRAILVLVLTSAVTLRGQSAGCDMQAYKPADGLRATRTNGGIEFAWNGEAGATLRAVFTLRAGQPLVSELAARNRQGGREVLGRNLRPEYEITTGRRRLSEQQMAPLRKLGIALTPDVVEREQWNAFWDAPLMVPGTRGTNLDLPRKASEIRHDHSQFHSNACTVRTRGARLEIEFNGLTLGIFSGSLRYTVYRGTNLLRQEAIAKTEQPDVAYKYDAGLDGFSIAPETKIVWRDTARAWQQYAFGGDANQNPVALKARNRLVVLEAGKGSLAVFPPPHKFFFAREIETNLGFVYYRKDSPEAFALGVRQAEREEPYRSYGVSDNEWNRRVHEARHDINNFALYNAPPGAEQHMPVYFYLNAANSHATQQAVLAFTHDDRYEPPPGYKVLVSHFHMHFNEQLTDAGTMDLQPTWLQVFRALGINMVILADFHSDSHPSDPGPIRFTEQNVYFEGCRRFSDYDFLLIPGEEADANFGGHYMTFLPRPVYWSHVRTHGQQFVENDPKYGKVYHVGSPAEELEFLNREGGLMWQAHPRTKGSAGYPDAVKNEPHFLSDRFLGGSFQSLPVDQSEKRLCEARCLGLLDDMNNWAGPKYMLAEGDTYMKDPGDETYPQLIVNYVKLSKVPSFDGDWTPLARALRAGDYFVSSGEVLLRDTAITGAGPKRVLSATVSWTFPLDFVELVWGDGSKTDRRIISTNYLPPFGSHHFEIPFDAAGKKWVRFAAWDSAGDGAIAQPVHLR
jgi:hypothetical protein